MDLAVHGPHGGGARRGRPRRARLGARCCAAFYGPLRDLVDEKRRELRRPRLHDRADRRGLLAGPPDGDPARAQRPVPRLLALPGAQGDRGRCPGEEPEAPALAGRRRAVPRAAARRTGRARRQARPVRPVRRLLPLSRLQLHQEGRPAAAGPAAVRGGLPDLRRGPPRRPPRAADRVVFWGCSRYPKCDFTTSREPLGPGPRRRTAARSPAADDETALCLGCGATVPLAGEAPGPGRRIAGGPADPAALARRPARAARAPGGGGRRSSGGRRRLRHRARRDRTARRGRTPARHGPARRRRHVTGAEALERFLASLAARDASPHTRRAYARRGRRLPRLARRRAASTGGARRGRPSAPTSRELTEGRARATVAQRLAAIRSFHRWARRTGLVAGGPVGRLATPRRPRRLPTVLAIERGRAAPRRGRTRTLGGARRRAGTRPPGTPARPPGRPRAGRSPCATWPSSRRPTRPGLRISELAGRDARLPRPAPRRDPGRWARAARSGSASSAGRPARRSRAYLDGGPAGPARRRAGDRRRAPADALFLNHRGGPLGVRGIRYRLDRPAPRAGPPGGRHPAHAAPLVRHAPPRRRRRPARRPGAARPREPRARRRSTRTSRPAACAASTGGPTRGPRRATGAAGEPARPGALGPGRASRRHRARSSSRGSSAGSGWSVIATSLRRSRPRPRRFFAAFRIPDLLFQLVAAGALASALIPTIAALVRDGRGGAGLAGRLDRREPDARRSWRAGARSSFVVAPALVAAHHARASTRPSGPDVELTRIMLLSPIFLAAGAVATSVLNAPRPVRGRRSSRRSSTTW